MLRADSSKINTLERDDILAQHGLLGSAPLAIGTEAAVYVLDDQRILKIYAGQTRLGFLETLRNFYSCLDLQSISFALPEIYDVIAHHDLTSTVEKRIDGVPLETLYSQLGQDQLNQVEKMYIVQQRRERISTSSALPLSERSI